MPRNRSFSCGTASNKRSIGLNLKHQDGLAVARQLCLEVKTGDPERAARRTITHQRAGAQADVLIEPYRPGVMERMGLGPAQLCAANPRLIFARLTGFGQTGARALLRTTSALWSRPASFSRAPPRRAAGPPRRA